MTTLGFLPVLFSQTIIQTPQVKKTQIIDCVLEISKESLIPSSVRIIVEDTLHIKNFIVQNNTITLPDTVCSTLHKRQVNIYFRTFPYNIKTLFTLKNKKYNTSEKIYYFEPPTKKANSLSALRYNGSFSRGLAVGNAQDLSVYSAFNLQLNGKLGNGIQIKAALSDTGIPLQAEGNTQYLQEFDRVYIELNKDSTALVAGDYALQSTYGHFLKYRKKVKGLGLNTTQNFKNHTIIAHANVSISKGKFSRQTLNTEEGNQGPYRLVGNARERFLIILSGSEKVYLDGTLLTRGRLHDYVIDYNSAEIRFTQKNIITETSRVIVEYEYQTQSYLKTMYTVGTQITAEKYKFNVSFLSESDSKNAVGQGILDSTATDYLSTIGNDLSRSNIPGIQPYSEKNIGQQPTYIKENISVPNDTISFILIRSDNQDKALYTARFSDVGTGNGRYILDTSNALNGRIYKYVGKGQGRYEPYIQITPPESRKYLSLGGQYDLNQNHTISSELTTSVIDLNRFSTIGDDSNKGVGLHLRYEGNIPLDSTHMIKTAISAEIVDKNFQPVNPYRSSEFARDWNIDTVYGIDQLLAQGKITYKYADRFKMDYTSSIFSQRESFQGIKNGLNAQFSGKNYHTYINTSYLTSKGTRQKSRFFRPELYASRSFLKDKSLKFKYKLSSEDNQIWKTATDTLLPKSRGYVQNRFSIEKSTSKSSSIEAIYLRRTDKYEKLNTLSEGSSAREYSLSYTALNNEFLSTSTKLGYRTLNIDTSFMTLKKNRSKNTLLADLLINFRTADDFVSGRLGYQTKGGTAPKLEFYYEKVLDGQGDYIYIGNPDSTILINNFRYAPELGTGNFIRVPLYNDEYISTQNNALSYDFTLDFKKWQSLDSLKNFAWIKRFRSVHALEIDNRLSIDSSTQWFDILDISNSNKAISGRINLSNSIYFNRGNSRFSMSYTSQIQNSLNTQTNGISRFGSNRHLIDTRIGIQRGIDLKIRYIDENRTSTIELAPKQNRDIDSYTIMPSINIRTSEKVALELSYSFTRRIQRILNLEHSNGHTVASTVTLRNIWGFNKSTTLSYTKVAFNGVNNSLIEFDLLQGLKKGNNYKLTTRISRRINKVTELSFVLDIHKYGSSRIVNIFRAQARALF